MSTTIAAVVLVPPKLMAHAPQMSCVLACLGNRAFGLRETTVAAGAGLSELTTNLDRVATKKDASPYSTGGGGTVLEHRYGATLLARLLTGDAIPLLGDDITPLRIMFQRSPFSPVDDIVATGRMADGRERLLSIGVRRSPAVVKSDAATVGLVASYLKIVRDHWTEVETGRWRMGLIAAGTNAAIRQVAKLAEIARATPDEAAFRAEVGRPKRTTAKVRDRLTQLDAIVVLAANDLGPGAPASELTRRLLLGLWPVEIRLEGADQADRAESVGRLRTVTATDTPSSADALFNRLTTLVDDYAPAGAVVTEAMLRRDLAGFPLRRSRAFPQGWSVLDRLASRLRDRTGTSLHTSENTLEIDRAEQRNKLRARLEETATNCGALIVRGDPDVGKSALTLRVVEELRSVDAGVVALNLRNLPLTMVEFESAVGADLSEVLGGACTRQPRILVIDGAEAVLEGWQTLLIDLATASLRAGLGVAAVTRSDASARVAHSLASALQATDRRGSRPVEHEVPALCRTEIARLTNTFTGLTRLERDARSVWVLGRPGLIDLLLRSETTHVFPDHGLSEADVFAAIWDGLVRRPSASSPDAREHVLVALARRLLFPSKPLILALDSSALTSLRSDGLLLSAGRTSAWSSTEEFASDLVRDLAVARLLLVEGWQLLTDAEAPRWALRAVRLACQAKLIGSADAESERVRLQGAFDEIAAYHGQRWAELPLEALLTLGTASDALTRAWPVLTSDQHSVVLRLAQDRYARDGVGDAVILAPLVELSYCQADLEQYDAWSLWQVRKLVLAWLRGLVHGDAGPHRLRRAVRDVALESATTGEKEFLVELVALLGPDMDERAEAFLRDLAKGGGAELGVAVESNSAVRAIVDNNVDLLVELTEARYLGGWPKELRRHAPRRYREPEAAGHYGPYSALLNTDAAKGLPLIQRLLNRAAVFTVQERQRNLDPDDVRESPKGAELEFPDGSRRFCVGNHIVWQWYDQPILADGPCGSALLAVERFADHLIDIGVPINQVVNLLLEGCENLAMPALVVSLLVKHIGLSDEELDPWLAQPEVWQMEAALCRFRPSSDSSEEPEVDHDRSHDLRRSAMALTVSALAFDDKRRIQSLKEVGARLLKNVHKHIEEHGADTTVAARGHEWPHYLNAENYGLLWRNGKIVEIRFEPPFAGSETDNDVDPEPNPDGRAFGIVMGYHGFGVRPAHLDKLIDDLAFVQSLASKSPDFTSSLQKAGERVATAVVAAHFEQCITFTAKDLRWAANTLMDACMSRYRPGEVMFDLDILDSGGNTALITLLLPSFAKADVDYSRLERCLIASATAPLSGFEGALAQGLSAVWAAPCNGKNANARCRHEIAWAAIESNLRGCKRTPGDWRAAQTLAGPLTEVLPRIETEHLISERLPGPLAACAGAARSSSCVAKRATRLLDVLLDAHRRSVRHEARRRVSGGGENEQHQCVAGALLAAAAQGNDALLTGHIRAFADTPRALGRFLRELSCQATYNADLRQALPIVWPIVMRTALDACQPSNDTDFREALAALVPEPRVSLVDPIYQVSHNDFPLGKLAGALGIEWQDPEEIVSAARADWIEPDSLQSLVERWLPLVRGEPHAADILIGLARSAPKRWQTTTGLSWMETLISGDFRLVALLSQRLPKWLAELHCSNELTPSGEASLHRIVDGLAAEGNTRAVSLQLTLE